jgi:hypothetical protein
VSDKYSSAILNYLPSVGFWVEFHPARMGAFSRKVSHGAACAVVTQLTTKHTLSGSCWRGPVERGDRTWWMTVTATAVSRAQSLPQSRGE